MKVPTITKKAIQAVSEIEVEDAVDCLRRTQPVVVEMIREIFRFPTASLKMHQSSYLAGALLTLEALKRMPNKTPANRAETLQDRLDRIRGILTTPSVTTGGLRCLEDAVAKVRKILDE